MTLKLVWRKAENATGSVTTMSNIADLDPSIVSDSHTSNGSTTSFTATLIGSSNMSNTVNTTELTSDVPNTTAIMATTTNALGNTTNSGITTNSHSTSTDTTSSNTNETVILQNITTTVSNEIVNITEANLMSTEQLHTTASDIEALDMPENISVVITVKNITSCQTNR